MSIRLTDTQLVILSAAAQRDDRCLTAPKSLKGASAQKVASKLIAAGLVKEIKAKPGVAVWRRDDEAGRSFALKLTSVGMKAIAAEDDSDLPPTATASSETPTIDEGADSQTVRLPGVSKASPREGTKAARVIGLLQQGGGATLAELIAATDWLPHTTRAALTGLRKRGYPVTLDRADKERGSTYFIPRDHVLVDVNPGVATMDQPPALAAGSKKASASSNPEPAGLTTAGAAA